MKKYEVSVVVVSNAELSCHAKEALQRVARKAVREVGLEIYAWETGLREITEEEE